VLSTRGFDVFDVFDVPDVSNAYACVVKITSKRQERKIKKRVLTNLFIRPPDKLTFESSWLFQYLGKNNTGSKADFFEVSHFPCTIAMLAQPPTQIT
jgi:hypothetical protein